MRCLVPVVEKFVEREGGVVSFILANDAKRSRWVQTWTLQPRKRGRNTGRKEPERKS